MANKRFDRIASALANYVIARRLIAADDLFVLIDDDGAHEVDRGTFMGEMRTSSRKVAKYSVFADEEGLVQTGDTAEDLANDAKYPRIGEKWTIYVSPDVNAINAGEEEVLFGFPRKVKNFINTMMNRLYHKKIIDGVINSNDLFGYTIEKGEGRYPYKNDRTGELEVSKENSYIITIYCDAARSVAFKVADELRSAFKQKGVLVDVGRGGQMVEV